MLFCINENSVHFDGSMYLRTALKGHPHFIIGEVSFLLCEIPLTLHENFRITFNYCEYIYGSKVKSVPEVMLFFSTFTLSFLMTKFTMDEMFSFKLIVLIDFACMSHNATFKIL